MLQSVNTTGYTSWPGPILSRIPNELGNWKKGIPRAAVSDVAQKYPEAVVVSSDVFAWQNIRLLQLRHSMEEMVVPACDSHCVVLNLSAALTVQANLGKRRYEGTVRAGEVAIIPAGTNWSCQSHSSHLHNTVLLYLRPLFVRRAI